MRARARSLAFRRQRTRVRIAEQREQLVAQLAAWAPVRALEAVRAAAERVPRKVAIVAVAIAFLALLAMHEKIASASVRIATFAARAARWWSFARLGLRLLDNATQRTDGPPRRP
jgi:hypothetical protein